MLAWWNPPRQIPRPAPWMHGPQRSLPSRGSNLPALTLVQIPFGSQFCLAPLASTGSLPMQPHRADRLRSHRPAPLPWATVSSPLHWGTWPSAIHIPSHPALIGAYIRLISPSPRPEVFKSGFETTQQHLIASATTPSKFGPCLNRLSGECSSLWGRLSSHGKHFAKSTRRRLES